MNDDLLLRIRKHAQKTAGENLLAPASEEVLAKAEKQIGISLPPFLRSCYLEVGNGGFGPGYGLMPLGEKSDDTLIGAYKLLSSQESWPVTLLPVCDWGCAIYSCVDTGAVPYPMVTCDEGGLFLEPYDLEGFFEQWVEGVNLFSSLSGGEMVTKEAINPFTGEKITIRQRVRK